MKAGRPALEKACTIPTHPPHPGSFLLGRNLRRPLTGGPRVAATPSAGAERRRSAGSRLALAGTCEGHVSEKGHRYRAPRFRGAPLLQRLIKRKLG